MAVAIPKVQVPMNFGVQYLGSPAHSNMKFLAKGGEELLANSMIISYNSPVVEDLTTNLFQSVIEVDEFTKDAVKCFLEATYSGEVKDISKATFRDFNKLGHVFGVSWIVERCYDYFKSLLDFVNKNIETYDYQVFLFEEAMYVYTTLKKRNYLNTVINSFSSLACCSNSFVTEYVTDLSVCSTVVLEAIIEMVGKEEEILLRILLNHLEENNCIIDDNTRYILKQISFIPSTSSLELLYKDLIEKLQCIDNPSKDDFKLITGLLKQCYSFFSNQIVALSFLPLPNLFQRVDIFGEMIVDHESLAMFLKSSPIAANSFTSFDAVSSWLFNYGSDKNFPFRDFSDSFVDKFHEIMVKRGWNSLPNEYINSKRFARREYGNLASKIANNLNLVTNTQYNRIESISTYSQEDFFGRNHNIKFKFKHESYLDCDREGDCGFILRVTAASGEDDDSFNIQLVINSDLYPRDIHFHRKLAPLFEKSHFSLDVIRENGTLHKDFPVTWYGKPCRDRNKKHWCWGAYRFFSRGESTADSHNQKWFWYLGAGAKIRPVIYFFS